MNRRAIINQVKSLILEQVTPVRIWLYGSEATGDAKEGSDIDIAYLDPREDLGAVTQDLAEIKDQVENISTLLQVDVSVLNGASDRFINRVTTTGKVLYSNSKPLRAEDGVNNFEKALMRLKEVLNEKETLKKSNLLSIYTDVVVKRFEFTFEMSWKAIKRVVAMTGLEEPKNPRQCFKVAFAQGYITDEALWLDMIEMRNLTAHTYDADEIAQIVKKIESYNRAFSELLAELLKELDE